MGAKVTYCNVVLPTMDDEESHAVKIRDDEITTLLYPSAMTWEKSDAGTWVLYDGTEDPVVEFMANNLLRIEAFTPSEQDIKSAGLDPSEVLAMHQAFRTKAKETSAGTHGSPARASTAVGRR